MFRTLCGLCLLGIIALPASPVHADDLNQMKSFGHAVYQHKKRPDYDLSVGVAALNAPEFMGSGDNTTMVVPLVELEAYDDIFISTTRGMGYRVVNDGVWRMGPFIHYDFGRDESDSTLLSGMGDIDASVQMGAFVEVSLSDSMQVDTKGYTAAEGYVAEFGVSYQDFLSHVLFHKLRLGAVWQSDDYSQEYFGVNTTQAANSAYQFYSSGGGVNEFNLNYSLIWGVDENWGVLAMADYTMLAGDAADSPLTKAGSEGQLSLGAGLIYRF